MMNALRLRLLKLPPAAPDDPRARDLGAGVSHCGWFESSHELSHGVLICELAAEGGGAEPAKAADAQTRAAQRRL